MGRSLFFTNHTRVLALLARDHDLRLREVADAVGITERAAHRIISELVDEGYLGRERRGSRNRYTVLRPLAVDPPTAEIIGGASTDDSNGDGLVGIGAAGLRAALDTVSAGVVVTDASATIVAVNRAFCEILRTDEARLLGRSLWEHTDPDDLSADEEWPAVVLSGARTEISREHQYLRGDGSSVSVELSVRAIADSDTGRRLLVAQVVETGERKRQQRELAEAEERFRSAFDAAPTGIALVSLDGRWLEANRAMCEITGYSETGLLARSLEGIAHPDDLEADRAYARQLLADEILGYQHDIRLRHADRHIVWVSLSVSLVRDRSGGPLYFIAQVEDVTHRRDALREISQVVDRLAEAVSVIDADGTHLHVNEASRRILEDLRERFEKGPLTEIDWGAIAEDGSPLSPARLPAEITRLTGQEIDDMVVGFPSVSGDTRWLRISTRRLSAGPAPYQVIVSYTDVTERRQAE